MPNLVEVAQWTAFYVAICASIFALFERVEKWSNKDDIDHYYLLLTVKRNTQSKPVDMGSSFQKTLFGEGYNIKSLVLPRMSRVFIFTLFTSSFASALIFPDYKHFPRVFILLMILLIACSFVFDYVILSYIRFCEIVSSLKLGVISGFITIALLLIFPFLCIFLSTVIFGFFVHVFVDVFPELTAKLLKLKVYYRGDTKVPDWGETFYVAHLAGTPVAFIMTLASSVSIIVAAIGIPFLVAPLFRVGVYFSQILYVIPSIQDFLDNHTSVREKPLQIISAILVILFTVLYWIGFAAKLFLVSIL